jgi:hypothetical protein
MNNTRFVQTVIVVGFPPNSFTATVACGADAARKEINDAHDERRWARFTSPAPLEGMASRPIFLAPSKLGDVVAVFEQEVEIPAALRAQASGIELPGTGRRVS